MHCSACFAFFAFVLARLLGWFACLLVTPVVVSDIVDRNVLGQDKDSRRRATHHPPSSVCPLVYVLVSATRHLSSSVISKHRLQDVAFLFTRGPAQVVMGVRTGPRMGRPRRRHVRRGEIQHRGVLRRRRWRGAPPKQFEPRNRDRCRKYLRS